MKKLRFYQQDGNKEIINAWNKKEGIIPYVSIMTGLGKSLMISDLTHKALQKDKRVLQLVPRRELVEQNLKETLAYIDKKYKTKIGVVCSQMKLKDNKKRVTIAMASSFLNMRSKSGFYDVILIDECHNVKIDGDNESVSTYNKIINSIKRINPNVLIAGFTGTPYRLDQGLIHLPSNKGKPLFTEKVYDTSEDVGIKKLIEQGFLSYVKTLNTRIEIDLLNTKLTSTGEFNADDVGVRFDAICEQAVNDMMFNFDKHHIKTSLIFVSTRKNAESILKFWKGDKEEIRIIDGNTQDDIRRDTIEWLKNGSGRRYIVNIDILAVGFDYPNLQSVVMMRATKSTGLFVQIVGRVIRVYDDKKMGYLIDYGTNCKRLGTIDNIIIPKSKKRKGDTPLKLCPIDSCNHFSLLTAVVCELCNAEFPPPNEDGEYNLKSHNAISETKKLEKKFIVESVDFELKISKSENTMIVMSFFLSNGKSHSHYLCLDHKGYAGQAARRFIMNMFKNKTDFYRLGAMGVSANNIYKLLINNYKDFFKEVDKITLVPQKDSKFKKIKSIFFK